MRYIFIMLCWVFTNLQATSRIDSLKVDYIQGVYSFGKQAGALCGFRNTTADTLQHWEVHFLSYQPIVKQIKIHTSYTFIQVTSTKEAGYLVFEKDQEALLVRVSAQLPTEYIRISAKDELVFRSILDCKANTNNGVVLLRLFNKKTYGAKESHTGIEYVSINGKGHITNKRLHHFPRDERHKLLNSVPTNNGMCYIFEQHGGNLGFPRMALDLCNPVGKLIKRLEFRDSQQLLPAKVMFYQGKWIIAGYILNKMPDYAAYTQGFFTLVVDSTGKKQELKKFEWQVVKDSLYTKTLRPIILGSSSPNSFRTNGDIDLLIEGITTTDSGYSIICQGYSLGPGMTTLEFMLGMRDKSEVVLSLYDFVALDFTQTNAFLNFRLLDYTMSHVLIEPNLKTELSFVRAYKLEKLGVFPSQGVTHKGIYLVNYDTLVPRASFYSFELDSLILGSSLLIPLADTVIYTQAERDALNNSKVLSWIDKFDKKTEQTYDRVYEKSIKYAKGITKLDYWYNPKKNKNHGWVWLDNKRVTSYSYRKAQRGDHWTIYFRKISLPEY